MNKKYIFLDRDGVINCDPPHYAHQVDQLEFISGSVEAIGLLNKYGFRIIVITNQSGVAKGMYKEEDILVFHEEMQRRLLKKGAHIDVFYYCPHHPDADVPEYRINCECRKPKPGMIMRTAKDFGFDPRFSFLIRDKWTDIEAGRSIGCTTIMVLTGHGREEYANKKGYAHYTKEDLFSGVKEIILKDIL